jgi:hypothetical protein
MVQKATKGREERRTLPARRVAIGGDTSLPAKARNTCRRQISQSITQTNTQTPRKAVVLSWSLTRAHPAYSPQVIENKNTTGMNETRAGQNWGKCPENMAYHDIS